MTHINLIKWSVIGVVTLIIVFTFVGWKKVDGHQAVVRQHWQRGVLLGDVPGDVYRDGTHFYWPGLAWDLTTYNIGTQKLTFDSDSMNTDSEYPSIELAVGKGGGQKVFVSGSINYRIGHSSDQGIPVFDPVKLVALHKDGIGKDYKNTIVKRTFQEVVNSIARPQEALTLYSGQGFNDFRLAVDVALKQHSVFASRGIFVENTIIYQVSLDPKYETEIELKQLAVQTALKEHELMKAAEAAAAKVFAKSQAEVNSRTQKAEAGKIELQKAGEGERLKMEEEAKGQLAMLLAEAEGQRKMTEAMYGGTAGSRRYAVEFGEKQAKQLFNMLNGVKVITDKALVQLVEDPSVGTIRATIDASGD
jgi:hypothetical protein